MTKRLVTLIALAAVFAGLLLYVRYYESGPTKKERQDEAKKPAVVKADAGKFQSMEINGANGNIAMVKTDSGLWRMKTPIDARGDMIAMEAITNALSNFKAESKVPGKSLNLKDFGLDNPSLNVAATLKGGKKISLKIGGKTPVGENYYVIRAGDPVVYIVSGGNVSPFKKTVLELRDRSISENFRRSDVESVTVRAGGRETVCVHQPELKNMKAKKGNEPAAKKEKGKENQVPEWHFEGRETVDCENEADSLLTGVEFTEAKEFVDKPGLKLADYGLDAPKYVLEVSLKKGGTVRIETGSETGGAMYVRNARRNEIYQIEPSLVQSFDEFRKAASKI